uniref:Chromosome 1 open reading frame 141 n=1 Tax=Syphacia muris TaxID=451379 RepID=A0A0N5AY77_9BILA
MKKRCLVCGRSDPSGIPINGKMPKKLHKLFMPLDKILAQTFRKLNFLINFRLSQSEVVVEQLKKRMAEPLSGRLQCSKSKLSTTKEDYAFRDSRRLKDGNDASIKKHFLPSKNNQLNAQELSGGEEQNNMKESALSSAATRQCNSTTVQELSEENNEPLDLSLPRKRPVVNSKCSKVLSVKSSLNLAKHSQADNFLQSYQKFFFQDISSC